MNHQNVDPGCVPGRISYRRELSEVLWVDMRSSDLGHPFFRDSIRSALKSGAKTFMTPLNVISDMAQDVDHIRPTGIIFHSSRCGSTLLANTLRAAGCFVLSEAQPINALLSPLWELLRPNEPILWERERRRLLRGVVTMLGSLRPGRPLFLKLSSWNTLMLCTIRAVWPETKWIFLYRDPVEVVVSNMRRLPAWLKACRDPFFARRLLGWKDTSEVTSISTEELCARIIGQYYKTVLCNLDEATLLLNYSELTREAMIEIIQRIDGAAADNAAIEAELEVYSKSRGRLQQFYPDSEWKQASASDLVRAGVERWSTKLYSDLECARLQRTFKASFSSQAPADRRQRPGV